MQVARQVVWHRWRGRWYGTGRTECTTAGGGVHAGGEAGGMAQVARQVVWHRAH